jgi:hypothetical protein
MINNCRIVDHQCLNILCFIDIGRIVDHQCLNFLCFIDIGGIVDHQCLNFLCFIDITKESLNTDDQQFHQYQ